MLPHAQILILEAWAIVITCLVGLGAGVRLGFGAPPRNASDLLQSFWLGWAFLLCGLQIWHLFWPVDDRARIAFAVAGAVGAVLALRTASGGTLRGVLRRWYLLPGLIAIAYWISNRALGGPRFGDTGLYYIPLIRWESDYAIIPGLANLYVPFGHGQSTFLYDALLSIGEFSGRSYHIANAPLVLALLARAVLAVGRLLRDRVAQPADVFYALFLPAMVEAVVGIYMTTPSPDFAVTAMGIMLSGELVAFLTRQRSSRDQRVELYALVFLVAAAITTKLSVAALALAVAAIAAGVWLLRARPRWTVAVGMGVGLFALSLVAIAPWIIRNIVLSGCPLYPSAFLKLPVEWRVQVDMVKWIQMPMYTGGIQTLWKDPVWFIKRLDSLGWNDWETVVPLAIAAAGVTLGIVVRLVRRWRDGVVRVSAVIWVPTLLSALYCIAYAPMPRYAGATVWLIAVDALLLGFGDALLDAGRLLRAVAIAAVVACACLPFGRGERLLFTLVDFEPITHTPVREEQLPSGLVVRVPVANQTCFDAPPPCTPEIQPGLRLRRAGDLSSGFMIDTSSEGKTAALQKP